MRGAFHLKLIAPFRQAANLPASMFLKPNMDLKIRQRLNTHGLPALSISHVSAFRMLFNDADHTRNRRLARPYPRR
jgi:hypothetical protein